MKRYLVPAVLAAVLFVTLLPATTYTYVVRELNQTMTGVFSFGGGAVIPTGQKIYIGDSGYSSYLYSESGTGFVKVYIGGVLKATVTGSGVIPGACASDPWTMEQGTTCIDSKGQSIRVSASGPVVVTGNAP